MRAGVIFTNLSPMGSHAYLNLFRSGLRRQEPRCDHRRGDQATWTRVEWAGPRWCPGRAGVVNEARPALSAPQRTGTSSQRHTLADTRVVPAFRLRNRLTKPRRGRLGYVQVRYERKCRAAQIIMPLQK